MEVKEASAHYLPEQDLDCPSGYRRTEVGVIPDDWEETSLGAVTNKIIGGGTPSRSVSNYWNGDIPWMTVKDFAHYSPFGTLEHITEIGLKNSASNIIPRRTLIASTRMALGKAVIYEVDVCINQDLKAIFPNNEVNTDFLYFWFQFNESRIAEMGSGSTVMGISLEDLKKIPFAKPTKAEQEAIAGALSDTGALIESLEQLIAKKRHIKQGAMQELLRPKEGWVEEALGSLAMLINGRAYALHEWESSGVPVIRLQNLTGRGEDYYYSNLTLPDKQYCYSGDLLFMWSATFGPIIWRGPKAIYHYHIWKIECRDGALHKKFLFYVLSDITEKLKNSSASGGTMLHLTKSGMENLTIHLPSYLEQEEIASVLADMDTEITTLETKLAKTRQLKQGMMHELLTGRIRLVKPAKDRDS
ncbi:MAG TPA: restriction endonuclease subunit S [Bacteroidetes bacterium]|nr:restriction endonuclease subunit S [Bacteroidota bacterium]HEX04217.1 restriction endonuclease subunit S [Bacteroidota bacterium]